MTAPGVCLAWALVNGEQVHAETMRGVPHSQRPRAVCPCCSEQVVWKAGDVVTPHVAHAAGSTCAATNPETAAHWNAKFHVASLMRSRDERNGMQVRVKCNAYLHAEYVQHWPSDVPDWVQSQVERTVGNRRPDVALIDDMNGVIAAIEIKHAHAIDDTKIADYKRLDIPWIEIDAQTAAAWDGEQPISVLRVDEKHKKRWLAECPVCTAENIKREQAQREHEQQKRELARTTALTAQERKRLESEAERLRKHNAWLAMSDEEKKEVRQRHAHEALLSRMRSQGRRLYAEAKANPPKLEILVAASVFQKPGTAAIAACLLEHNAPVRLKIIDGEYRWKDAVWVAVQFAIDRLAEVAPGRSATIYTHDSWCHSEMLHRCVGYVGIQSDVAMKAIERGHFLTHSKNDDQFREMYKRLRARVKTFLRSPAANHNAINNTGRAS